MQASKVRISEETLSEHLTKQRKSELRRQRVIELIQGKPEGCQIKLREFAAVAEMSNGTIHGFLSRMAKQGYISIERLSPSEITYHVLNEKPSVERKVITPHEHYGHERNGDVAQLALRFFWETQSDSLHEFVEWVKNH